MGSPLDEQMETRNAAASTDSFLRGVDRFLELSNKDDNTRQHAEALLNDHIQSVETNIRQEREGWLTLMKMLGESM